MDKNDLSIIANKIASEGIEIKNKDSLKDIYKLNDLKSSFDEFDILIKEVKYKKQELTLIFYLGLFNLIDFTEIKSCDIKKLDSYPLLKGGLIKYFLGHISITYKTPEISFNRNYFSFIDQWYSYKLHPMKPLFSLLNWIYRDDEEFFFDLFFKDNSNYLFITLIHGGIIEDFEFDEKYIQFGCDDEIKLYAIFYYLINPYHYLQNYDVENFKSNLSLIMEIPLNFLMKIVLDYIRSSHVKIVPMEFVNMIKENDALFYETFNRMEIYSFYELLSFLFLLKYNSANFQNTFFKCILKKLESLLMNKFIHIKIDDLKLFYSHLSKKQISEVLLLLIKIKENLVFVSEFDLQVRYEKYLIDIGKYDKLTELIEFSLSFK